MFITSQQAMERLNSQDNLAVRFGSPSTSSPSSTPTVIPIHRPGKNRPNLTIAERTEIAVRTRTGEPQKSIQKEFGLTQATVSNIETGKAKGIDEVEVDKQVRTIQDRALDRLMASMNLLTDDKLSGCSAKDLSTISSNLSKVVANSRKETTQGPTVQIVVYTPELRTENSFEVVTR